MTSDTTSLDTAEDIVSQAVADGGAYEVIRNRLVEQSRTLKTHTNTLNQARLKEFGSQDMSVLARVRVRTENNCIARDIVQVGQQVLFGYNVFIGLKKETKISDVFSLYAIENNNGEYELSEKGTHDTFLSAPGFVNDFDELYRYYKHTKLIQITINKGKLLAAFQIGEKLTDVRVFRWSVSADGNTIEYIDNRGERDIAPPPPFDFEWQETVREDIVNGRNPHVNINDTIFLSINKGYLSLKIEDNTDEGLDILREDVEDKTQSLDDASVAFARVGKLMLIKVLPYRETNSRYYVYNTLTQNVARIDAIGQSCVQLPEDHGIIFPGGYYLETGEHKTFDEEHPGLMFNRSSRSPNGEDVLYVFYEPVNGVAGLFSYNLINKTLNNPIYGHGVAQFDDGLIIIFSSENEPTRVHPMQIWQTPFFSAEYASRQPESKTSLGKIGNSELVRGISALLSVTRIIDNQSVSMRLYEELVQVSQKMFDHYYWLTQSDMSDIAEVLGHITKTAELVIDEFEKVQSIRQQSAKTLQMAVREQETLLNSVRSDNWETAEDYVNALKKIRNQRGHIATIKDQRYMDVGRLETLASELLEVEDSVSDQTVDFLMDEQALAPYFDKVEQLDQAITQADTLANLTPLITDIEATTAGLDLLSELMSTLDIDDATVRTRIIDSISEVYAKLNQSKAQANHHKKTLGSTEAVAQFGAQFKLFSQSITNALGLANDPEKCDEQLSRLLARLEELESQFSDYEEFLTDIVTKREEIYQAFESHKQQLLDEQNRKAQSVISAANRILKSIEQRAMKVADADALNTYFASDSLVSKVTEFVDRLRDLDAAVAADDIDARYKSIKEQAIRGLRDKHDIYENDGKVIKLGPRHKFSVNTQALDLTLFPRDGEMNMHLTGTDFYEALNHQALNELKPYWSLAVPSETDALYRAEYLAGAIIHAAQQREQNLSPGVLTRALLDDKTLATLVRDFATPRYQEGYEKGIHDHDATRILQRMLPAIDSADLLIFDPASRALARIFWASLHRDDSQHEACHHHTWVDRARSAAQLEALFASDQALTLLIDEVTDALAQFVSTAHDIWHAIDLKRSARYLVLELGRERTEFITSQYALELVEAFKRSMNDGAWRQYTTSLNNLSARPGQQWQMTQAWLEALVQNKGLTTAHYIPEAIALLSINKPENRRELRADLDMHIDSMMGTHPRIKDRVLTLSVDTFLSRVEHHRTQVIPAYQRYQNLRQTVVEQKRRELALDSFKAKPLSSFVRNRLINEAYLPIIGDNLAKQMGALGDAKRTDLMGLLMMISPPGYGKTTLMEYVASKLGLIFMKINCPSLGHDVMSLDPAQAPNSTAKQELEKINLSFEMGNNVMLYLDDIQHTHPEFLQKYISLCDGTRRIEGVWKGESKTYDMRGRKFCVVMAGNPYTESGEVFKIPDMLANRADIYNLGDILGGMDEQFALSYIENSLTSNPVLAPLALRDLNDVYQLIRMSRGENIATTDLSYEYSGAEINEITEVFKKLFVIQDVVLKINQQYILSAAQDDKYRTEPAFKLQGSYRNMNKMAEKVSAVMNQQELMGMIADHYQGEAQLLTTGAEANLLKLAELRGNMTEAQATRWEKIKADFLRNKALGGDDADTGNKMVVQLNDIAKGLTELGSGALQSTASMGDFADAVSGSHSESTERLAQHIDTVTESLNQLSQITAHNGQSFNELMDGLADKMATALDKPTMPINEAQVAMPDRGENSQMVEALITALEKIDHAITQTPDELDQSLVKLAGEIGDITSPLIKKLDKKLSVDLRTYFRVTELSKQIAEMKKRV